MSTLIKTFKPALQVYSEHFVLIMGDLELIGTFMHASHSRGTENTSTWTRWGWGARSRRGDLHSRSLACCLTRRVRAPAHPQALSPRSPKERPQLKPPGAHLLDLNRLQDPWARHRSLTPAPARRSSSSTPALGRAAGTWPRHPPVGARPQHHWGGRVLRRLAAPGKKIPCRRAAPPEWIWEAEGRGGGWSY